MLKYKMLFALLVIPFLITLYSCSKDSKGQDAKKRVFISTDIAAGLEQPLARYPGCDNPQHHRFLTHD